MRRTLLCIALILLTALPLAAQDDVIVLENYDGSWEDVIKDLETLGMIPAGGELRFAEDYVSLRGPGTPFNRYASNADDRDFVIGGELRFTSGGDELENCMLLARTEGEEWGNTISIVGYLGGGIIQAEDESALYAVEWQRYSSTSNRTVIESEVDFEEPVYLLLLGIDNNLMVFANGELVLEEWEIQAKRNELQADRGGYGFGMITDNESRCEGNNLWAYGLPDDLSWDDCEIRATGAVNKRSGPGTSFEIAGKSSSGETYGIIEYAVDESGFTWWHLDDDSWMREDLVEESGMCRAMPQAESEEE